MQEPQHIKHAIQKNTKQKHKSKTIQATQHIQNTKQTNTQNKQNAKQINTKRENQCKKHNT